MPGYTMCYDNMVFDSACVLKLCFRDDFVGEPPHTTHLQMYDTADMCTLYMLHRALCYPVKYARYLPIQFVVIRCTCFNLVYIYLVYLLENQPVLQVILPYI